MNISPLIWCSIIYPIILSFVVMKAFLWLFCLLLLYILQWAFGMTLFCCGIISAELNVGNRMLKSNIWTFLFLYYSYYLSIFTLWNSCKLRHLPWHQIIKKSLSSDTGLSGSQSRCIADSNSLNTELPSRWQKMRSSALHRGTMPSLSMPRVTQASLHDFLYA